MGLHEPDGEEKGRVLLGERLEFFDGLIGDLSVGVGVVGHIAAVFPRGAASSSLGIFGEVGEGFRSDIAGTAGAPGFFRPALEVVVDVMKNLAQRDGGVAVGFEMGIQRRNAGHVFAGSGEVSFEAILCRPNARHQGGPGGAAGGNHAVGAIEPDASAGQSIEIRCHHLIGPKTGDLGAQIIDRDEQDIGFLRRARGRGQAGEQEDGEAK